MALILEALTAESERFDATITRAAWHACQDKTAPRPVLEALTGTIDVFALRGIVFILYHLRSARNCDMIEAALDALTAIGQRGNPKALLALGKRLVSGSRCARKLAEVAIMLTAGDWIPPSCVLTSRQCAHSCGDQPAADTNDVSLADALDVIVAGFWRPRKNGSLASAKILTRRGGTQMATMITAALERAGESTSALQLFGARRVQDQDGETEGDASEDDDVSEKAREIRCTSPFVSELESYDYPEILGKHPRKNGKRWHGGVRMNFRALKNHRSAKKRVIVRLRRLRKRAVVQLKAEGRSSASFANRPAVTST
mmetsp:Transcript_90765/g.150316  ORF Transcript_90765/g.150316 Transcript_90765/m.150316 type:complete len:315 (-) Transcript_90765:235-1179(-)